MAADYEQHHQKAAQGRNINLCQAGDGDGEGAGDVAGDVAGDGEQLTHLLLPLTPSVTTSSHLSLKSHWSLNLELLSDWSIRRLRGVVEAAERGGDTRHIHS